MAFGSTTPFPEQHSHLLILGFHLFLITRYQRVVRLDTTMGFPKVGFLVSMTSFSFFTDCLLDFKINPCVEKIEQSRIGTNSPDSKY
jgi:hypothetical protein